MTERERLKALEQEGECPTCKGKGNIVTPEYREYKRWGRMCPRRLGESGAFPCVLDFGHWGPHIDRAGHASTRYYVGDKAMNASAPEQYREDPHIRRTKEWDSKRLEYQDCIQSLLLAMHEGEPLHDDEDCPEDDTCDCKLPMMAERLLRNGRNM